MLYALFNDSVFKALENAYPNRFYEWELAYNPRNFWDIKSAKVTTIWLFKKELKWSDEEIIQRANKQIFIKNGLYYMLHAVFHQNVSKAIQNAFPNLIKKTHRYKNINYTYVFLTIYIKFFFLYSFHI